MRNKVGNTRLQNMAHLQMIILLLVTTSAKGCDEKACNYGTAIAGTTGAAIGTIGGVSCAFTFGIGCLVAAAGTIAAAGTTLGSKFCNECSETPSIIPLEKLDEIMKEQKETFQKMSQSEINDWFSNNQRFKLKKYAWFSKLTSTQKTLVTGQMVSKLNQKKILKDLTTLVSTTQQIQKSVDMLRIIDIYHDSISNLVHLRKLFNDMQKDELGGIIDDFNSDDFIKATNHFKYGSKRNTNDVMKMLSSGHHLESRSLWEIDQSYCRKTNVEFFSSLLYSSFEYRRIALQMEGKTMSKREAQRFENDAKKVKRSYDKHCFCVDAVNEDSSSRCVKIAALHGNNFYKVRTYGSMTLNNLKSTCTWENGLLTPCGISSRLNLANLLLGETFTSDQDSNCIVPENSFDKYIDGTTGGLLVTTHSTPLLTSISKKICKTWDVEDCPQLDSIFVHTGHSNGELSASFGSVNGIRRKDFPDKEFIPENKWSLCMTEKGMPKPTGYNWPPKKADIIKDNQYYQCNLMLKLGLYSQYIECKNAKKFG